MLLLEALARHDGVAHIRTLTDHGVPATIIRAARRSGAVSSPRRGWIASDSADPTLRSAVSAGGRIGCATQASRLGMWMLNAPGLHLSLPRHSGHARPPSGAVTHWRGGNWRAGFAPADALETVVQDLADCLPTEDVVCALDSALNLRLIELPRLRELLVTTRRGGHIVEALDGRADSGLESLVRLRLTRAGVRATPQHIIAGVGRIDLLVGDRLVIECDGRIHHDDELGRAKDRSRDIALIGRGYLVVRLDIRQIQAEWAATLAIILSLVARREHVWSAAHRRAGLSGG